MPSTSTATNITSATRLRWRVMEALHPSSNNSNPWKTSVISIYCYRSMSKAKYSPIFVVISCYFTLQRLLRHHELQALGCNWDDGQSTGNHSPLLLRNELKLCWTQVASWSEMDRPRNLDWLEVKEVGLYKRGGGLRLNGIDMSPSNRRGLSGTLRFNEEKRMRRMVHMSSGQWQKQQ